MRIKILLGTLLLTAVSVFADIKSARILTDNPDINYAIFNLNSIENQGLCGALENMIIGLDKERNRLFDIVEVGDSTLKIEDFFMTDNRLVVKSDNVVLWTDGKNTDAIKLEDANFSLKAASDSSFFVIRISPSEIFEFSLSDKKPILHLPHFEPIISVFRQDDLIVVVSEKNIMGYAENQWFLLHNHPYAITTASFTPLGLFCGTEYGFWRLTDFEEIELYGELAVKKLMSDGATLYLIDGEDNIYALEFED